MFKLNCSALRTASSTMSTTYPVDLSGHRLLSSAGVTILTTRKEMLWLWDFLLNWSSRPFAPSEQWGCLHPQTASSPSHSSHTQSHCTLLATCTPHIPFSNPAIFMCHLARHPYRLVNFPSPDSSCLPANLQTTWDLQLPLVFPIDFGHQMPTGSSKVAPA